MSSVSISNDQCPVPMTEDKRLGHVSIHTPIGESSGTFQPVRTPDGVVDYGPRGGRWRIESKGKLTRAEAYRRFREEAPPDTPYRVVIWYWTPHWRRQLYHGEQPVKISL